MTDEYSSLLSLFVVVLLLRNCRYSSHMGVQSQTPKLGGSFNRVKLSFFTTIFTKETPMGDFFKNLQLDYWYKVALLASLVILVIALTTPLQVSNHAVVLISLGGFLIGTGEWINHPLQEVVNRYQGYKVSGHPRNNKPLGILFVALGIGLLCFGIWKLI
jgi:hypothetical protein